MLISPLMALGVRVSNAFSRLQQSVKYAQTKLFMKITQKVVNSLHLMKTGQAFITQNPKLRYFAELVLPLG